MNPNPDCEACLGTGVGLVDGELLIRACACVEYDREGVDHDAADYWAKDLIRHWRSEQGDRLKIERLSKVRQRLLGKTTRSAEEETQLQETTDALGPLLGRIGYSLGEADLNHRMMEYVRVRLMNPWRKVEKTLPVEGRIVWGRYQSESVCEVHLSDGGEWYEGEARVNPPVWWAEFTEAPAFREPE